MRPLACTAWLCAFAAAAALPVHAQGVDSIPDLVDRVKNVVVNVEVTARVKESALGELPLDDLAQRFFGRDLPRRFEDPPMQFRRGIGSGFLISADGLVVTNHHVVAEADAIRVKLANGNFAFISGVGTLVEMDPGGKQIRSIQVGQNINWGGLEALPGNRFLVALSNPGTVKEVDANGKTVWEAQVPGASHATRLPNGNTIVACMNNQKLVEINKAGKTVWEKTTNGRPFHVHRR